MGKTRIQARVETIRKVLVEYKFHDNPLRSPQLRQEIAVQIARTLKDGEAKCPKGR